MRDKDFYFEHYRQGFRPVDQADFTGNLLGNKEKSGW